MVVESCKSRPFEEVDRIGVAIREIAGDQLHSGFIYKFNGNPVTLLHLAWHHDLRRETPSESYLWADVAELEEEDRRFVASFLNLIGSHNPDIPYGFNASGITFDPQTGLLINSGEGRGLTCATFILEVFRVSGFLPIDPVGWPVRDSDAVWQAKIIQALEGSGYTEHAKAVLADGVCARYRPEEVVGATASPGWSHGFRTVESIATEVLRDLGNVRNASS